MKINKKFLQILCMLLFGGLNSILVSAQDLKFGGGDTNIIPCYLVVKHQGQIMGLKEFTVPISGGSYIFSLEVQNCTKELKFVSDQDWFRVDKTATGCRVVIAPNGVPPSINRTGILKLTETDGLGPSKVRFSIRFNQVGDPSLKTYYLDSDGDGFGDFNATPKHAQIKPPGHVLNNLDKCPNEASSQYQGCKDAFNDREKNWRKSKVYDRTGALLVSTKEYYDDNGRLNQTQIFDSKKNQVLVKDIVKDERDRPVLTSSFFPIQTGEHFGFKTGLIKKKDGQVLHRGNIDDEIDPEIYAQSALGRYYENNMEEPLMDKTKRPYERAVYSKLSPGNLKYTIGGNKLNGAWRHGFSFSSLATQELYYAFGMDQFESRPSLSTTYTQIDAVINNSANKIVWLKASKSVVQDVSGTREYVSFTDSDGKVLATAMGGGPKYEVLSLIGPQKYVDIHIPLGCAGTARLLGAAQDYKIYDLKTEKLVPNLTASGFYRVEYIGRKNLTKEDALTYIDSNDNHRIKAVRGNNVVGVRYEVNYHNYSLNYYNLKGQLVSSLQPLGFNSSSLTKLNKTVLHNNKLKSYYKYNTLGQLIHTHMPDEGDAWYVYRKDGQIRFSINTKQWQKNEFSYTEYDDLGRPQQSGVYSDSSLNFVNSFPGLSSISMDTNPFKSGISAHVESSSQIAGSSQNMKEVIRTRYDFLLDSDKSFLASNAGAYYQNPTFLSGNVAKTSNTDQTGKELSRTYYSYDVYGRVRWVVQQLRDLGVKTIDYEYDPVTSQVTKMYYQKGKAEQFVHAYTYDAKDQKLIEVKTSTDDQNFTSHAKYRYYSTSGALKQVSLAGGIQDIDYVYNLAGQLKAINHPSLNQDALLNKDKTDLFGMTLDYYRDDYRRSDKFSSHAQLKVQDQYGGNIKAMTWNTKKNLSDQSKPVLYEYSYDDRNFLKEANFNGLSSQQVSYPSSLVLSREVTESYHPKVTKEVEMKPGFHVVASNSLTFSAKVVLGTNNGQFGEGDYKLSNVTYDANGNIKSLRRNKNTEQGKGNAMDDLTYHYSLEKPNQLLRVEDKVLSSTGVQDIKNQVKQNNYIYNAIGQLIENQSEEVVYEYNAAGLVNLVKYQGKKRVAFFYNDKGFRTKKLSYDASGVLKKTVDYILDASGKTLAVYENKKLVELPIYGINRLGVFKKESKVNVYQLTDHLGNVRAVIAKKGSQALAATMTTDYYPFGMPMPNRQIINGEPYRYAYQGQEKDPETGKEAFQLRLWDARIGRWLTTDPKREFSSPYLGMGNNPLNKIDPDGGSTASPDNWIKDKKTGEYFWDVEVTNQKTFKAKYNSKDFINMGKEFQTAFSLGSTAGLAVLHYGPDGNISLFEYPRWLAVGYSHLGLTEGGNSTIQGMIDRNNNDFPRADGLTPIQDDSQPWCGVFTYTCLKDGGVSITRKPGHWQTPALNTFYKTSWADGKVISKPVIGAIAVMKYGHVAMVAKHDSKYVWILGGNQPRSGAAVRDGVEVNITRYRRSLVSKYIIPNGYNAPPLGNFKY